jgi:hypothetical protein
MNLSEDTLRKQSITAYTQWATQWRDHAKKHASIGSKSMDSFMNIGVGKAILCVANGYSLEENIETIKKNQKNVDIICCDKTLGHLLDNGITPQFCVVCDANVNFEKYMAKWKDQLKDTILFINVCANPEWSFNGNWKDVFTFVNKDIINSHEEFSRLSGCTTMIPAGTNVSNAMIILITRCENNLRQNFFGYDKIILIGFDYSWKFEGHYYAFDKDGGGKEDYMRHMYLNAEDGTALYTSGNLYFSMNWLHKYIATFKLPVVQCAKHSILQFGPSRSLENQIKYQFKTEDSGKMKLLSKELEELGKQFKFVKDQLNEIGKEHWLQFFKTV